MKLHVFLLSYLIIGFLILSACKKEDSVTPPQANPPVVPTPPNTAPIANAGQDIIFSPSLCINSITVKLDGSKSTDADGNLSIHSWKKISGPGSNFIISDAFSLIVMVKNLEIGEHAFELTVRDAGNLESRDTVLVSLKKGVVKTYDIDVSFMSPYSFKNNAEYADWDFGSFYIDETQIRGFETIDSLGNFDIYVSEYADTTELSDVHNTDISIIGINPNPINVVGTCSINFKKLIREGGGAFSGTYTITNGTADYCEDNIFKNFPPLTVTGSLDVATRMVTFKIKGKVYF